MVEWVAWASKQSWGKNGGLFLNVAPKLVFHTTEGSSWPGYNSGGNAPHLSCMPLPMSKELVWRQHSPLNLAARAMANKSGGIETNRANALQIELVGTCRLDRNASPNMFKWANAPDWALKLLGEKIIVLSNIHDFKLTNMPQFIEYPASYGATHVRFNSRQWYDFNGICGHQHIPENTHGDPGPLKVARAIQLGLNRTGIVPFEDYTVVLDKIIGDDAMFAYVKGDKAQNIYLWSVETKTRRNVAYDEFMLSKAKAESGDKRFDLVTLPQQYLDSLPKAPGEA